MKSIVKPAAIDDGETEFDKINFWEKFKELQRNRTEFFETILHEMENEVTIGYEVIEDDSFWTTSVPATYVGVCHTFNPRLKTGPGTQRALRYNPSNTVFRILQNACNHDMSYLKINTLDLASRSRRGFQTIILEFLFTEAHLYSMSKNKCNEYTVRTVLLDFLILFHQDEIADPIT